MQTLVIFSVVAIVLILLVNTIIKGVSSSSEELACRNSVLIRAKAKLNIPVLGELDKFTSLVCNSISLGELKGNREEIKAQVADLAGRCWWMYLEGSVPNLFEADTNENKCGVCYYFRIPPDMDAGRLNEYRYFDELTTKDLLTAEQLKDQVNQLQSEITELQKNSESTKIDVDKLVQDIDTDAANTVTQNLRHNVILQQDGTEIIRPKDVILIQEMYNFLIAEQYNPKLLYGGGTKNYIGDKKEFNSFLNIYTKEEINLRNIKSFSPTHLQDYSNLITQDTKQVIMDLGRALYTQENSALFVIVADKITRNDRTDARRLIEQLNLNSEKHNYDAILITIDLTGNIRIHAGADLEHRIKEHEITAILHENFETIHTQQQLNAAIIRTIEQIRTKLISEQAHTDLRLPQGTYYQYLSNDQTNLVYIENIQADRTYAIVYAAHSDYVRWFERLMEGASLYVAVTIASVAAVGAVVLIATTGGGATPLVVGIIKVVLLKSTLALTASTLAVGGVAVGYYNYLAITNQDLMTKVRALRGTLGSGVGDNSLFIVPASEIANFCGELN